jgi:ABC-type transport system substrate-binding protein
VRNLRPLAFLLLVLPVAFLACSNAEERGAADSASSDSDAGIAGKPKIFNDLRRTAHKTLDPMKQFDQASAEIVMNVYDTLLEYHYLDRPYRVAPNLLAEMPVQQPDGVTYLFRLKPGIHFHDDPCFEGGEGRELVADDAIYSIKRFADANVNNKSWALLAGYVVGLDAFREKTRELGDDTDYDAIEVAGLRRTGDYSFEVEFTRDNPLAMFPFAMTSLSIVPREAVEHYGKEFAQHPVGTGPFVIKHFSRRGMMILARNPSYHGHYPSTGAPGDRERGLLERAGEPIPFLDEIHLPLIEEPQPAMLKFKKAEIDWIGINKDDFPTMAYRDEAGTFHLKEEYARRFDSYAEPRLAAEYLVFNMRDPLIGKNRALRQAIAWSLDSQGIIDLLMNGRGLPLTTPVPHPIAGSQDDPALAGFHYYHRDVEMARKRLAEAGYPDGKGLPELVFEYRAATRDSRQAFEFIRNELAEVGIRARANFSTFSAFLKKVESGNFRIASSGWAADYPDGENFYQLLYGPNKLPGPNSSNFQNAEYDALYEQIRFMRNGPERFELFKRMAQIVKDEVPIFLRYNGLAFGMFQRNVLYLKRHMLVGKPYKYLDKRGSPIL